MKTYTVVTVTGIRPDFIRMAATFKLLDREPSINHIMVHTGQHFDNKLSGVFFDDLCLRRPNYNLNIGGLDREHFHQSADLSVAIIELFREKGINPDLVVFLGDSNSVTAAVALKKEGYKICHIEAGMRSGDKRMLEEINRIVCDHCSDLLLVYHENYRAKLAREGISKNVHVVGNTIAEPCKAIKFDRDSRKDTILLDIHRPENFKYPQRLQQILDFANYAAKVLDVPRIHMLKFKRTMDAASLFGLRFGDVVVRDLMSFNEYTRALYNAKLLISDSGTAQEEACLFKTKCIVPRDFTERPESADNGCSFMLGLSDFSSHGDALTYAAAPFCADTNWLYDWQSAESEFSPPKASRRIVQEIKKFLAAQ